jgi:hypothetical protein
LDAQLAASQTQLSVALFNLNSNKQCFYDGKCDINDNKNMNDDFVIKANFQKVFPLPTVGAPPASKSPSALSAQALDEVKGPGVIILKSGLNHKIIIHVFIVINVTLAIIETLFIAVKVEESNRKLGLRSSQLSVQLQEATSMHNAKVIMMMMIVIMILMMVMMIMPVQRWL